MKDDRSTITVHFYDPTGREIVRTRIYRTADLAWAAIKRAQKRGQIAGYAGKRTINDPPTCHH